MPLEWHGEEVAARALRCSTLAIDKTLSLCVGYAKTHHPWQNRTGTAEGSIRVVQWGKPEGDGAVVGQWGSTTVRYFIFLELGTSRMPPYPTLRPTADAVYPFLREFMARAWRGEAL